MNVAKIIPFNKSHILDIAPLFPDDWHFDFEKFINLHGQNPYFKGYTFLFNNTIIGFGNLFLFGKSAWLGNIVVDTNFRGKGFGSLITKHLIEEGRKNRVKMYNLIATELGQPIYEKLGFKKELNYEFYISSHDEFDFGIDPEIRKATKVDFENIQCLDFQTTGENRKEMLKFYLPATFVAVREGKLIGFFIDALETGSIVAIDEKCGLELLKLKLNKGNTKIIIPENNISLKKFLAENSFKKKLSLPKMFLGEKYHWQPENIFNRGAGYCG